MQQKGTNELSDAMEKDAGLQLLVARLSDEKECALRMLYDYAIEKDSNRIVNSI